MESSVRQVTAAVAVVVGMLMVSQCMAEGYCPPRSFCGPALSDALAYVCNERGYNFKRSATLWEKVIKRSRPPTIIEECCLARCGFWQLEAYCAAANGRGRTEEQFAEQFLNCGGGQAATEGSPTTYTATEPVQEEEEDSGVPSAELLRGEPDPEDRFNFFYVPQGSQPTRNPLVPN